MSKVRYYLQSPKSERTRIRLTFHYGRRRLVYYTGDVIEAKHWNPQTERMRKNAPGHLEINTGLDRLESITLEIFRTYRNDGKPLPLDLFRQEIDAAWKGKIAARPTALSLFELWGEKIAEMRRSFASNEYLRAVKEGRSFRPIMDILGMTKEATFLRYVKVDRLAALVDWVRGR